MQPIEIKIDYIDFINLPLNGRNGKYIIISSQGIILEPNPYYIYHNSKLHCLDGPAIKRINSLCNFDINSKRYYINGEYYPEEDYWTALYFIKNNIEDYR